MADEPEHYVSGEANASHQHSTKSRGKKVTIQTSTLVIVIAAIALSALSFAGGMAYQKHNMRTTISAVGLSQNSLGNGNGGFGMRRAGTIGEVTSVTSSKLTITDSQSGGSSTYTITANTTVTDAGQTASVGTIQVGDTVVVTTSSSDSSVATRIILNPNFGGGPGKSNDTTTQNN